MGSEHDELRRRTEDERLAAARARAAEREASGTPAPWSAGSVPGRALKVLLSAGLGVAGLGIGGLIALTVSPVVGALVAGLGVGAAVRAAMRASRESGGVGGGDLLSGAYGAARTAIDESQALDEERRIELLGALRGGYEGASEREAHRDGLVAALATFSADSDDEDKLRVESALARLDADRDAFIDHCRTMQATVATLALSGGGSRTRDLEALADATRGLSAEAEAQDEMEAALDRARARRSQDVL